MLNRSLKHKIYFFLAIGVVLISITAIISYKYGQQKWVLYRQAENAFTKKDYLKAIKYYHLAISKKINLWYVGSHLADSCLFINKVEPSLEIYENLVKEHPNNIYILMATATFYVDLNRFDRSIELYKRALELKPRDHKILHDLALCYMWNEQYLLAVKTYKNLLSLMKKPTLSLYLEIGDCYLLDEQYFEAMKYYQKVLDKRPDSFDVLQKIASAYSCTGQENTAITILEKLLSEKPKDLALALQLIKIYIQDRFYDKAGLLLDELAQKYPENEEIIFEKAKLQVILGNMLEAKKTWDVILKNNGHRKDLYPAYAEIMQNWKDFSGAEDLYKNYLQENPFALHVLDDLAALLIKMDRFYEAEKILYSLLDQKFKLVRVYEKLTQINLEKGDYQKALYWVNKMISEDGVNSSARLLKVECYIYLKDFKKAEEEINKIPPSFFMKEEGVLPVANLYLKMGLKEKAQSYFSKAIELEPEDLILKFYIQFLLDPNKDHIKEYENDQLSHLDLQKMGDIVSFYNFFESAIDLYEKSLKKNKHNFNAKLGLATTLFAIKKYTQSLKHLLDLREDFPNNFSILLLIARNYKENKDYIKASYYYDLLQKISPENYLLYQEEAQMAYKERKPNKAFNIYQKKLSPSVDKLLFEELKKEGVLEKIERYQDTFIPNGSIYKFYEEVSTKFKKGKYPLNKEEDKKIEQIFLKLNATYHMQKLFFLENEAKDLMWNYNYRKAKKVFDQILKTYPSDNRTLFDNAEAACLLGLCDQSSNYLKKIVDVQPYHTEGKKLYLLSQIRKDPYIKANGYYWNETGYGDLDQIITKRADITLGYPFYCRHLFLFKGLYWYEKPKLTNSTPSSAWGYSITGKIRPSEYFKLAASFEQKTYEVNFYPTAYTGLVNLWYTRDCFNLGGGLSRENQIDNYFSLLKKIQFNMLWLGCEAVIKKRLKFDCTARWKIYNDHNYVQFHDLNIYYYLLTFSKSLRLIFTEEYQNTGYLSDTQKNANGEVINIIHPYWTPQNYNATRAGIEWYHDLSALGLCSSQKHFYLLKAIGGTDSEHNPMCRFEAQWKIEFLNHCFFAVEGMIHRSKLYDADEAKLEFSYQF